MHPMPRHCGTSESGVPTSRVAALPWKRPSKRSAGLASWAAQRRIVHLVVLLLLFQASASSPADAADAGLGKPPEARERIALQLKWRHQFQFAGYYAAVAKGFYREAGLDVDLLEPSVGEDPVDVVASGRATYGIGTSELVVARAKGLPVVALAAIYQHSPYTIVSLRDRGIDSIHDLAGKRLMYEPQAAEMLAYLHNEGISADAVELVPHRFDTAALLAGEVDAMTAYVTDEVHALEAAGVAYQLFFARSAGIDFYGDVLFTTEGEIGKNPARVATFVEASMKGWRYALAHPEEIVDIIHEQYGGRHSTSHLLFEAEHGRKLMAADVVEIGYMHEGRWRHIADTYARLGMMPEGFTLDGFVFQPGGAADTARLRRLAAVFALALATVGGVGGWFWGVSRRLRREVAQREAAQRRAETALARERNLLSILAHDFSTPLATISAASQLLARRLPDDDAKAQREVGKIHAATRVLAGLISSCLARNDMDGIAPAASAPVDLRRLLEQVVEERQALAPDRKICLDVEEDAVVEGDAVLLSVAFSNLVDNAVKYSTPGGAIRLRAMGLGEKVLVAVSDDGPGIAAEEVERIFEKYYRSPRAAPGGGAGIGLFMVRAVLDAHGGTVEATPAARGEFTVSLPRRTTPHTRTTKT